MENVLESTALARRHISLLRLRSIRRVEIYAFTRPGATKEAEKFALDLGAVWAGGSNESPTNKTGRRDYFCAGGRPHSASSKGCRERRKGSLRRHSHDRHPVISV